MSSNSMAASSESSLMNIANQFGVQIPSNNKKQEWVYPEIVKSRTIAKSILKRKFYNLKNRKEEKLLNLILNLDSDKDFNDLDNRQLIQAVEKFISMIEIKKNGLFYDLVISASEPKLARDLNVALIEELNAYQERSTTKQLKDTKIFIEDRLSTTYDELTVLENNLKDFRQRNRRIENSPLLQLQEQRLMRDVSVHTGVYTTLKQQLETTKIEEVKDKEYVIVLDDPEVPPFPYSPQKRKITVISLFLSLGASLIIAFIRDFLQSMSDSEIKKFKKIRNQFLKNSLS